MRSKYLPAKLVKGSKTWYISYYQTNPETGNRERKRITCDLNRFPDVKNREELANQFVNEINAKLPFGWPFKKIVEKTKINALNLSLDVGFDIALAHKQNANKEATSEYYKYLALDFKAYINEAGIASIPIHTFSNIHAIGFFDWLLRNKTLFSHRTHNNVLIGIRALFTEIVKREMLEFNHFKNIERKKGAGKVRREFTATEKHIIIKEFRKHDPFFFLAILFIYHLFIRPEELRRIRFHMFDIKNRSVLLPSTVTKNGIEGRITIPESLVVHLEKMNFSSYPANHFIFGKNYKPNQFEPIIKKAISRKHKYIMTTLHKKKVLENITGLQLYSWKDTGAMDLVRAGVNIMAIKDQMRHEDISTTQKYMKNFAGANESIKDNPSIIL